MFSRAGIPVYNCGTHCRRDYTAASTSCNCCNEATSLFLVSQKMNEEATEVFYKQNMFVLAPTRPPTRGIEVDMFFKPRSTKALQNIRTLKFVVDRFYTTPKQRVIQGWARGFRNLLRRITDLRWDIVVSFQVEPADNDPSTYASADNVSHGT